LKSRLHHGVRTSLFFQVFTGWLLIGPAAGKVSSLANLAFIEVSGFFSLILTKAAPGKFGAAGHSQKIKILF